MQHNVSKSKIMTAKTVIKNHKGKTYVFVPDKVHGYKTSAKGYSTYWYQSTASVIEAKRRLDKN